MHCRTWWPFMLTTINAVGWSTQIQSATKAMSEMHWIHFSNCTKFSPSTIDPLVQALFLKPDNDKPNSQNTWLELPILHKLSFYILAENSLLPSSVQPFSVQCQLGWVKISTNSIEFNRTTTPTRESKISQAFQIINFFITVQLVIVYA